MQSLRKCYEGLEKLDRLITMYLTLIAPCSGTTEGWNCDLMHERAVTKVISPGSNLLAVLRMCDQ